MARVSRSNACYTGGGIYIITGQLENGHYILTSTDSDWYGDVLIVNADPEADLEAATFPEWQDKHLVRETGWREGCEITIEAMEWILANRPDGNYLDSDIKQRIEFYKN